MAEFQSKYSKVEGSAKKRLLKAKFAVGMSNQSQFMHLIHCWYRLQVFNSGFDALESLKGEWRLSVASMREGFGAQLVDALFPIYAEFYRTYSTVKFSKKHMSEYVRYQPQEVERKLRFFFGKP